MVAELRGESRLAQPGGAPRAPPLGGAGLAAVALPRAGKGAEHAMGRESTEEPRGKPVRGRLFAPGGVRRRQAERGGGAESGVRRGAPCGVRCGALCDVHGVPGAVLCALRCRVRGVLCRVRGVTLRCAERRARVRFAGCCSKCCAGACDAPDTDGGIRRAGCGAVLARGTCPGDSPARWGPRRDRAWTRWGLSCRVPRDDFGGRLRLWGQSRSCRAPGCTSSACSEPSCADWGAGV